MRSLWFLQRVLRWVKVQTPIWLNDKSRWRGGGHHWFRIFWNEFGRAGTFSQICTLVPVLGYNVVVKAHSSLRDLFFVFLILLQCTFFRRIRDWRYHRFCLVCCHLVLRLDVFLCIGSCTIYYRGFIGCWLSKESLIRCSVLWRFTCRWNVYRWPAISDGLPSFCHTWVTTSRFALLLNFWSRHLALSCNELLLSFDEFEPTPNMVLNAYHSTQLIKRLYCLEEVETLFNLCFHHLSEYVLVSKPPTHVFLNNCSGCVSFGSANLRTYLQKLDQTEVWLDLYDCRQTKFRDDFVPLTTLVTPKQALD